MFDWNEILDFWFGPLDDDGLPETAYRRRWFRSDRRFDQELRRRFLSMVLFASEHGLEHWRRHAGGALAEILLLDQFSRNIFRGVALAFDQDRQARQLCQQAMRKGFDMALPPVQRAFLYMPLQHSEREDDQALAVECYTQLVASTEGPVAELMKDFQASAEAHQDLIRRFRRFPHRNKALGRRSTPEEEAYMASGGARFGQ